VYSVLFCTHWLKDPVAFDDYKHSRQKGIPFIPSRSASPRKKKNTNQHCLTAYQSCREGWS